MRFRIAVVVASYNRPECLQETLGAISAAGRRFVNRTVIDDHSDWGKFKQIRTICATNDFRLLRKKERNGLAKAWNLGIISSHARRVLVLVDDVILRPDGEWMDFMVDSFNSRYDFVYVFKKKCWAIDKAIIPLLGWYDEKFPFCGYGDGDLYHRLWLLAQESKLKFVPGDFDPKSTSDSNPYAFHIPHRESEITEKRVWAHGEEHFESCKYYHQKWEIDVEKIFEREPSLRAKLNGKEGTHGYLDAIGWRSYTVHRSIVRKKIEEEDFYPEITEAYRNGIFKSRLMSEFYDEESTG